MIVVRLAVLVQDRFSFVHVPVFFEVFPSVVGTKAVSDLASRVKVNLRRI